MSVYTDQLNRKIQLTSLPKRIISLVPSQTELLYDLGLRDEVAGITKFCIHPEEWFRSKPRIGGTKKYDFEKIKALRPDLIIGNKEENEKVQIEELMKIYPVWMSDIYTLSDALNMITSIGTLTGKSKESMNLKLEIESGFNRFRGEISFAENERVSTAYLIWKKPFMAAGHDTFINEMLGLCGLKNVFETKTSRYPEFSSEELINANPSVILLSSEPYPFKERHVQEFREILPEAKVKIVDGEIFSWYGSRLLKAPDYFRQLIRDLSS
jgi:ABC-type Fe3+-hydroxamate transport system substrate-binding protein